MTVPPLPGALRRRRLHIATLTPDNQTISFASEPWSRLLSDPSVAALTTRKSLSRKELTVIGDAARAGDRKEQRALFFATLMWGYGDRAARGPRYAEMALTSGRLDVTLASACEAITRRDLGGAWSAFGRNRLPGYDQAFFTKYLYFAAKGDADWEVRPLIRDSLVLASLEFLRRWLGADLGRKRHRLVHRYFDYCTLLAGWADELNVTPDQLEMFLYRPGELQFDAAPDFRRLSSAAIADVAAGRASQQLIDAVTRLPEDVRAANR